MTSLDTNVNNYTITELLSILNIDELDPSQITDSANKLISSNKNNSKMVNFLNKVKQKVLDYANSDNGESGEYEYQPEEEQTDEWYDYEALPQSDKTQKDKITDRFQKIDVYDNQHVPMKKEQLGVNNVFETPVAQDILNPNLKNITSRIINLDSQFRQASGGIDSMSTNYTLDLSDPLTDVLSLRLGSVQIPYTWYIIDKQYGNTCFWITNKGNSFRVSIDPGNYVSSTFVQALIQSLIDLSFSNPTTPYSLTDPTFPVYYQESNGKITINMDGSIDPSGNTIEGIGPTSAFDIAKDPYFTFFDFSGEKTCGANCFSQNLAFNNSLGWLMGFRAPVDPIIQNGNVGSAVLDLIGPKYFIIVLDDFNQNHINNGLISITELSNVLKLPSYYNPTLPTKCTYENNNPINAIANLNQLDENSANVLGINPLTINTLIAEKINISYKPSQQILPTAPRTLTQAQIYTINEIIKNKEKNTSFRGRAPTSSDTFAIIPLKLGNLKTGELYSEFGGTIQENKRIYFGPVDIDRMQIKLIDDKGFLVDLHGGEWCVTIISENLYQY